MENILVLGMGKVGSLVGLLLSKNFKVKAVNQKIPHYDYDFPFECVQADVTDLEWMEKEMAEHHAEFQPCPIF